MAVFFQLISRIPRDHVKRKILIRFYNVIEYLRNRHYITESFKVKRNTVKSKRVL